STAHAKGDRQKDWAIDAEVKFDSPLKAGFLPVARTVFTYRSKPYEIWFDGRDPEKYWYPKLPKDSTRAQKKTMGWWPFIFGLILAVSAGFYYYNDRRLSADTFKLGPLFIGFLFAFLFGALRSSAISSYSKKLRNMSLAQKKLEEGDRAGNLSEAERKVLFNASKPVSKPFLANTNRDFRLISIISFVVLLMVSLGFGRGPFFLSDLGFKLPSFLTSQSETKSPADKSQTRGSSASPSSSSASSSSPSSALSSSNTARQSSTPSQSSTSSQSSSSSQQTSSPAKTTIFDRSKLTCSWDPNKCLDQNGQAVTGLVYDLYEDERTLYGAGYYKNGLAEGIYIECDDEGNVDNSVSFSQGLAVGLFLTFHKPEDGASRRQKLASVVPIANGLANGRRYSYDTEGRIISTGRVTDAYKSGAWYDFYSDGSIKSVTRYQEGKSTGTPERFKMGERKVQISGFDDPYQLEKAIEETVEMAATGRAAARRAARN
ncbi:MAG: hypothetical protein LBE31_08135, partial [Deltaproteobacteria bacterium]|nr:hypothetical protein [Deltaproteobacteria bacterium]